MLKLCYCQIIRLNSHQVDVHGIIIILIYLAYLEEAIIEFTDTSIILYNNIQEVKRKIDIKSDENVVRIINNQLMNIERAFIHDEGLPGRPFLK